jgi:hypothetical protein
MIQNLVQKNFEMDGITGTTVSDTIDLYGATSFSIQSVIDVNTGANKTFDSPETAALVDQSLTYTALVAGTSGNDITIELVDTGVPSQALEVSAVGNAIVVNLELDAGVAADLAVQDLTYTADVAGVAGNDITIAYIADGTAGAETVDVTGTDIVVHMDATPVTGSTATQIKTAVDASAPASALISVAVTGTGSNVQAAAAETPLADGAEPVIVSTGNEVKTAVNADDPGAADLVIVTGTNGSAVTALVETNLENGVDSEVDVDTDEVTVPAHPYFTGLKIRLTTTGTLPAGLLTGTDYFIIVISADVMQFASSLANALAGTPVDITDEGSNGAVNTITPTSIAGAAEKIQISNDGTNWNDLASATSITVDTVLLHSSSTPVTRYMRIHYTLTAGSMSTDNYVLVKGEQL